ncbi:MAG: hypothetical protein WC989_09320 [Micavibrio sp.]
MLLRKYCAKPAGVADTAKDIKYDRRGSALIYILVLIALLAMLTSTLMDTSSSRSSAASVHNTVSEISSQIEFIRSAIQECVLAYSGGDAGMPSAPVGGPAGRGQYPVRPYPLVPHNTYLATPRAAGPTVSDLRCPGNPGNSNNHAKIFSGVAGKFLPPPPSLFSPWLYYNNVDGVFFMTRTDKPDAFLDSALQRLDEHYSRCEFSYINADSANVHVTSNSDTEYMCPAGSKCIVVRMLTTGSAIYAGEAPGTCP